MIGKNSFFFLLLLLIGTFSSLAVTGAQQDFTAFSGNTIADSQIDGVIGSEWEDAGKYSNASVFSRETAEVWLKHDASYLYIAYRFTADSSNPWTAVQFTGNSCMVPRADGALFGHDEHAFDGYKDINFLAIGKIAEDSRQDGKGEIIIDDLNVVTVELKKPLNSGDTSGKDIAWSAGNNYTFRIMWDSDGDGSSGGNTSHRTTGTAKNLLLNPEPIPEIPYAMVTGFLVACVVCILILRKKLTKLTPKTIDSSISATYHAYVKTLFLSKKFINPITRWASLGFAEKQHAIRT